ncbi:MAG: hypothetical protein AAFO07_32130 [Bacteroidota bacterium]
MQELKEPNALAPFNCYSALAIEDSLENVVQLIRFNNQRSEGFELFEFSRNNQLTSKGTFFDGKNNFPAIKSNFGYVENNSSIWLPSPGGLIRFNPNRPQDYELKKIQVAGKSVLFRDLEVWGERYFWLTSRTNGLLLYDKFQDSIVRQIKYFHVGNQTIEINNIYLG